MEARDSSNTTTALSLWNGNYGCAHRPFKSPPHISSLLTRQSYGLPPYMNSYSLSTLCVTRTTSYAICVSNVFAMAFAAMQYPAMKGFCESMPEQRAMPDIPLVDISRNIWPQIRGPQLAVPIFIGLCTLGIWGLAFQLHKQYAWSIYRSVQGDSRMRARYLAYEVSA